MKKLMRLALGAHIPRAKQALCVACLALCAGAARAEETDDEVVFSVTRGLYDTAFDLELSTADGDAKIYYTTDYSEPDESSDHLYTDPIRIAGTMTVKAIAVREDDLDHSRNVTAHTYIFAASVADQTRPSGAPERWSDTNGSCPASYALSSNVIKRVEDRVAFLAALSNAPIVSVTLPADDLFGEEDGIYTHPESLKDLPNEIRQADVEWVTGENVFGAGVGITPHGGYSRRFSITAKKSFGLKFRKWYGERTLNVPVLRRGGCETDEFRTLILRAENNHHWTSMETENRGGHPEYGTGMHDQFLRSRQKAMDGWQIEGTHVHLFLNGLYWGVYNITESVSDGFAATTWGGAIDLRKEYNVVVRASADEGGYRARDGVADDYEELLELMKADLTVPANYRAVEEKLDIDIFIDYILLECFAANDDWPGNNWMVISSPTLGMKLRYVAWDLEKSLGTDRLDTLTYREYEKNNLGPMAFHRKLIQQIEYRRRFAERARLHLCRAGGALTAERLVADYGALAETVRPIMYAEAARWGSYTYDHWDELPPVQQNPKKQYGLDEWDAERTRLEAWFRARPAAFIAQVEEVTGVKLDPDPLAPRGSSENPWAAGDTVMAYTNGAGGLVIKGVGAMSNFVNAAAVPWAAVAGEVSEVSLGRDVTRIGVNALAGFAANVPVQGLTATVLNDSIIAPAGAISPAGFETVAIVDGKAYLGVSVYTSDTLANPDWSVATNGIIEVPAEGKSGFFYLLSKPAMPSDAPHSPITILE